MPTYVSMLNWTGSPQPFASDIRRSMDPHTTLLRTHGLHSLVFLPDEGDCAAVMVSTCAGLHEVMRLAAAIHPPAIVRVESVLFDDDPGVPAWAIRATIPPPAHDHGPVRIRRIAAAA